jgi:predicted aldo/keto reductase-like oxidoreductase
MLYRKLRPGGDELSVLGFGCMRLPQEKGSPGDGRIDQKRATQQIRMAIDAGVNYIDTAQVYHRGTCEPFLGRALSDGYREKVKLATKLPHWLAKKPEDFDSLLKSQIERLNTRAIDYYLLHALDGPSWARLEGMGITAFLDRAKYEVKAGHVGFSFHGDYESFQRIVDSYDWEFCQIQYNYLDEQNQAGTKGLKYAASQGLGVIIMEPLRGGLLAKRPPVEVEAIWQEAEASRSPAEWSLRWVWDHPEVTVVLSGMNDERQIEENMRVADQAHAESLSPSEHALIKRVAHKYRELMKAGCTGCRYCMPCPSGVDIPMAFEFYNYAHMYGDVKTARLNYLARMGGILAESARASLCEECGECAEKCPQKLPVPDLLKQVAGEMEGRSFTSKAWLFRRLVALQRWQLLRQGSGD